MYPHRIRLRGPWECQAMEPGATARRVTVPCRWSDAGLAGFRGTACFARQFGYPGRADPATEHIWLTCAGCTGCRRVRLNGQVLADEIGGAFAFDVTSTISDRNRLEIEILGESDDAGLWGEVALEIRRDAYLANVRVSRVGMMIVIDGLAVGTAPKPLELYALVDGRHADYRTITPNPAGAAFHIELAEVPSTCQSVRVELIHISAKWYGIEIPIPHWHSA